MCNVHVQSSVTFSNDRLDVPAWIKTVTLALTFVQRFPLMPPASRQPLLCVRSIKRHIMGKGALVKPRS
jgi:hypothetical protein